MTHDQEVYMHTPIQACETCGSTEGVVSYGGDGFFCALHFGEGYDAAWLSEQRSMSHELFPLGFLPIVGVVTEGGWVCTGVSKKHAHFTRIPFWRGHQRTPSSDVLRLDGERSARAFKMRPVDVGELLPVFDPVEQPGTWAVLLREFVREVCGGDTGDKHGQPEPVNLFWRAAEAYVELPPRWVLIASGVRQWKDQLALSFDTLTGETPAAALQRCWLLVRRNTYRIDDRGWDALQLDGTSRRP